MCQIMVSKSNHLSSIEQAVSFGDLAIILLFVQILCCRMTLAGCCLLLCQLGYDSPLLYGWYGLVCAMMIFCPVFSN